MAKRSPLMPFLPPDAATVDRETYLADAVRQFEGLAADAAAAGHFGAAVGAKARAVEVRSDLDQLRETKRVQVLPATSLEHRAEIVTEVRRQRVGATQAGSYVAAEKMLRLELELVTALEAERRQAELDAAAMMTEAEIREELGLMAQA